MSFAEELGIRTRRAADEDGEQKQAQIEDWLQAVACILEKVRLACIERANNKYNHAEVVLFDYPNSSSSRGQEWTEPFKFGLNHAQSLGNKKEFVMKELDTQLKLMGFASVKISDKGGQQEYRYVAELTWVVPETTTPSANSRVAGNARGNVVLTCGVCTAQKPATVLIPCGHLLCQSCATSQNDCPFCRSAIHARKVVFKP
eukprot:TRINITY_DN50180_c0_g1_i1.p1 TRINITY_DN50180_c0_g1~~TRINITY_DN50180_c0_g1_i1.p1  ORF type:complete len:202 (+),score=37.76 TRINITY_DN50180_c0_g1_i1:59-664(+)